MEFVFKSVSVVSIYSEGVKSLILSSQMKEQSPILPLSKNQLNCEWSFKMYWSSFFFPFIFISCRLITLHYCSGFCHTVTWISHGFTCISHPDPPSHLPLYPIPLGLPSVPALSTCLMHPTWAGDLFHPW